MLHPPKKESRFETTIFRNDDVAYDTDVEQFQRFSEIFHRFGFVQLNGVTLYGRLCDSYVINGIPCIYDSIEPDEIHDYDKCVKVSVDYIGDNEKLIAYLNSIPDPIALHGLFHSDYSQMSYEQQDHDIREGLRLLGELFPDKKVDTFIAPFNHANTDTYKICKKYGLRISAMEGEHLEERLDNGKGPIYEGELYRYHHHRFYPDSTFYYYDLSLETLKKYFEKFSYTWIERTGRVIPSLGLIRAVAYEKGIEGEIDLCSGLEIVVMQKVMEYLEEKDAIIQVGCGIGVVLYHLWASGYKNLTGLEEEETYASTVERISQMVGADISIIRQNAKTTTYRKQVRAVISLYSKECAYTVFQYASIILQSTGYIMFGAPLESEEELIDIAGKFNAMLIAIERHIGASKDCVYVFKRTRPKICLLCDRPNWAHDYSARELKKYLSDEFDIEIEYVINHKQLKIDYYDAVQIFFWGEKSYQREKYSKSRIIKQVSSHRWQYDAPYGPITIEEFAEQYLNDAATVICPSKILYNLLKPVTKNLLLCGKGYSPELFYYSGLRRGEMSLCMAGNLKDPVKGVEDILQPSAEGYRLDITQTMKHEELNAFYNAHDIYVVSSVHEADPLPLIESMACGCFPVASNIGIAPELIRHKENGYLVEKRTVEEFRKAFKWCEKHLEYIRSKAKVIADEIYRKRRWEIMAEDYREMFHDHLWRR